MYNIYFIMYMYIRILHYTPSRYMAIWFQLKKLTKSVMRDNWKQNG